MLTQSLSQAVQARVQQGTNTAYDALIFQEPDGETYYLYQEDSTDPENNNYYLKTT